MFYVLRTKDFKRVVQSLKETVQRENREKNTHYEIRLYGHGIETFEGVEFRKDEFIRAVKENREIVYVFRNFCPFSTDEIVHFMEKYALEGNPVRVYIVDPDWEIPSAIEPYVEVIEDYVPADGIKGLTQAQMKKLALLGKDPIEERKELLKKSGGVLEVLEPHEIDRAVGLEEVIEVIKRMRESTLGRGVLLMGVPGTGKTLIAKNLSKEDIVVRFNFSAVYQKYVGESEKRLRETLKILENFGDCYVFVDEFEKALATGTGDSGVSKRLLGEFLSWLEDRKRGQYLIATMNDLTSLPLELIRPGRWDFILGLTPPPYEIRKRVIDYYAQKYSLEFDSNLADTKGLTPADISSFYRVWKALGDKEKAKRYVKWTKDIHPRFQETLELVRRYAIPVWQEEESYVI